MLTTYHNNNKNQVQGKSCTNCIKNLNTRILKYYGSKDNYETLYVLNLNYYVHITLWLGI